MKTSSLKPARLIALLFVIVFSFASVQQLVDFQNFSAELRAAPKMSKYGASSAYLLVGIQTLIIVLLCYSETRLLGFFITFTLLAVLTAYIAVILGHVNPPCECLSLVKGLSWRQNFFLNLLLLLTAGLGLLSEVRNRNQY